MREGTHVGIVPSVVEELGLDLEVPAHAVEGPCVIRRVAFQCGEEVDGIDHVDLSCRRVVGQDVLDAFDGVEQVRLQVPVIQRRAETLVGVCASRKRGGG